MTHKLVYGKTVDIQGDSITETANTFSLVANSTQITGNCNFSVAPTVLSAPITNPNAWQFATVNFNSNVPSAVAGLFGYRLAKDGNTVKFYFVFHPGGAGGTLTANNSISLDYVIPTQYRPGDFIEWTMNGVRTRSSVVTQIIINFVLGSNGAMSVSAQGGNLATGDIIAMGAVVVNGRYPLVTH